MQSYRTVGTPAMKEYHIQKSRFITHIRPVATEQEAVEWLRSIQKKHYQASHNCYAYVINHNIKKSADDGEPAGTAGRPILEQILGAKCFYTAIIITRYFGGIKLGTGGLVRAYQHGAKLALETATLIDRVYCQQLTLRFDYTHWGKLEHELRQLHFICDTPSYTDQINWSLWVPLDLLTSFESRLNDWTNGQIKITYGKQEYQQQLFIR